MKKYMVISLTLATALALQSAPCASATTFVSGGYVSDEMKEFWEQDAQKQQEEAEAQKKADAEREAYWKQYYDEMYAQDDKEQQEYLERKKALFEQWQKEYDNNPQMQAWHDYFAEQTAKLHANDTSTDSYETWEDWENMPTPSPEASEAPNEASPDEIVPEETESPAATPKPTKKPKATQKPKKKKLTKKQKRAKKIYKLYKRIADDCGVNIKPKNIMRINCAVEELEQDKATWKCIHGNKKNKFNKYEMQALMIYLNGGRNTTVDRGTYKTIGVCQLSPMAFSELCTIDPYTSEKEWKSLAKKWTTNIWCGYVLFNDYKCVGNWTSDLAFSEFVSLTKWNLGGGLDAAQEAQDAPALIRDIQKCVKKLYKYKISENGLGTWAQWKKHGRSA